MHDIKCWYNCIVCRFIIWFSCICILHYWLLWIVSGHKQEEIKIRQVNPQYPLPRVQSWVPFCKVAAFYSSCGCDNMVLERILITLGMREWNFLCHSTADFESSRIRKFNVKVRFVIAGDESAVKATGSNSAGNRVLLLQWDWSGNCCRGWFLLSQRCLCCTQGGLRNGTVFRLLLHIS